MTGVDGRVRLAILERFAERGEAPSAADVATAIGEDETPSRRPTPASPTTTSSCSGRARGRSGWLTPSRPCRPASASSTDRGSSYGNCIWDALGIPAMLGADARIETTCPDCREPLELRVRDGDLEPLDWVAHFAVPAARWWDDIGHT